VFCLRKHQAAPCTPLLQLDNSTASNRRSRDARRGHEQLHGTTSLVSRCTHATGHPVDFDE
jgi:hypothetical protein